MDLARPDAPISTPIPRYRLRTPSPALHAPAYDDDDASASLSPPLDTHTTRPAMTNAHRRFHRRAPPATNNVLTVEVEVVATLDAAGNVVPSATVTRPAPTPSAAPSGLADTPPPAAAAQSVLQTSAAAPVAPTLIAVPAVPAVPSPPTLVIPSVPSVPPFPSDLTVPAYPFASGVPLASAAAEQVTAAALSTDISLALFTPSPSSLPESNSTTLGEYHHDRHFTVC
jgi:hypothetical protein